MTRDCHPLVLFNTKFREIKDEIQYGNSITIDTNFNTTLNDNMGKHTIWLTCVECNEPLERKKRIIRCVDYYWECNKCDIIISKDAGRLYKCIRCNKLIKPNKDLIFDFITPNCKELDLCYKLNGLKQYLCPRCHSHAIHKKRFRNYLRELKNRIKNYYNI